MKRLLSALVVIALAILCMPLQTLAQDTLDVAPLPPGNLNAVINSDTVAGGYRAHPDRVYRLERGSVYQVLEAINFRGNLTLIGGEGTDRPPVIMPGILPDNSSPNVLLYAVGKSGKVNLKNLYLANVRSDGNYVYLEGMVRLAADSIFLKMRNVIFEGGNSIGIYGPNLWIKYDVQDCHFRNFDSWYAGQPIVNTIVTDTMKIINNTFFNCSSYCGTVGYTPYTIFEHNTHVYGIVNPYLTRQGMHLHLKNNLYYAMNAWGGDPNGVINSGLYNYPDTASAGIVMLRGTDTTSWWAHLWWDEANHKPGRINGPEVWINPAYPTTPEMMSISNRILDVANNGYFLPKGLTDYYKAYNDTVATYDSVDVPVYEVGVRKMWLKRKIYTPHWTTEYTRWTSVNHVGAFSPNIDIQDPLVGDPGFPADVQNHVSQVAGYVNKIITQTLDEIGYRFPDNNSFPVRWPLPENLTYTNSAFMTAGSDGLPLGDLNWFPDKKAEWLKMTDVKEIETATLPTDFALEQNYPNPFNPTTHIEFALPKQARVTLKVYNLLGQEVATLVNQTLAAGRHVTTFEAGKLASGTYIYRLSADNVVRTSKMMLIK